jgi:hypothetical protein
MTFGSDDAKRLPRGRRLEADLVVWGQAPMSQQPVDGILLAEAARILACHRWTVAEDMKAGRLRSAGKNVRRGL